MTTRDGSEGRETRRVIVRRSRGGARFSPRGRTDGAPRDIHDEVDDAIEPEVLEQGVRMRSQSRPSSGVYESGGDDEPRDNAVAQRMFEVRQAGNAAFAKEHRLATVRRMLLRKIPLDQIAQQLQCSISTIEKDRAQIKKMMREEAKELNIDEMIGNQQFLYDEIGAMALRIASQSSGERAVPIPMQLAAMRTTLASQADKARFLQSAGVFDILRYRKAANGQAQSDIAIIMEQTKSMLAGILGGEDLDFGAFDLSQTDPENEDL